MVAINVETGALREAAVQFRQAASKSETVLNHVKISGIEPASTDALGTSETVTDYNDASASIAEAIVQLTSSLKAMDEKLIYAADVYEGLDRALTIR